MGELARLWHEVRADHAFLAETRMRYDDRYEDSPGDRAVVPAKPSIRTLLTDAVTNIGFQQLLAFRIVSMLGRTPLSPLAMLGSRLIRHIYGAEMHWATEIAPGIAVVHGNGLVLSREARIGPRCILFQNVTLGISSHPDGVSEGGAPQLHHDVHIGPGAVLLGPIVVGPDSKIAAGATVTRDIPPGMAVVSAEPAVTPRRRRIDPA